MHRFIWFFTGILLCSLGVGFLLLRPPASHKDWSQYLPEIQETLRARMGFIPEHLRLDQTVDLTGDGQPEALVAYAEGAAMEAVAVFGLHQGKPRWLLLEHKDHRLVSLTLRRGSGGAGRYGASFQILPGGIVVQGQYEVNGGPQDRCKAEGYRWDPDRKRFVVDPVTTKKEGERYCRNLCKKYVASPLRELFLPLCSKLGLD